MAKRLTLEYVASLDRGLRVLQTFSREHPLLTLSEVAMLTELSPATARRSLHTLERLGYLTRSGRKFLLRPKVLGIGAGYLSAINADVVLHPYLAQLVNEVGGGSSVSVLDDLEVVCLAHASASRAFRVADGAGARFPAYATSVGRVLLAVQPPSVVDAYFSRATLRKLTQFTETDPVRLRGILDEVRRTGFAATQDELDYGLVSVAVPIFGSAGQAVAAASCTEVGSHFNRESLIETRLPILRTAVQRIESTLARYPELAHSIVPIRASCPTLPRTHMGRPSSEGSLRLSRVAPSRPQRGNEHAARVSSVLGVSDGPPDAPLEPRRIRRIPHAREWLAKA